MSESDRVDRIGVLRQGIGPTLRVLARDQGGSVQVDAPVFGNRNEPREHKAGAGCRGRLQIVSSGGRDAVPDHGGSEL